jgi:hypothetical protein
MQDHEQPSRINVLQAEEPPESLKKFFVCVSYSLKQVHDNIILIGLILLTALAIYDFLTRVSTATPSPAPVVQELSKQSTSYRLL